MVQEKLRNVEIKAKVRDMAESRRRAAAVCTEPEQVLHQEDVFYAARTGRLKLRRCNQQWRLIQYDRPDVEGTKLSSYTLVDLSADQADKLHRALEDSVGITGRVNKTRHLFMCGQTRIHLDEVEGLGDFLEFEVVLEPHQTVEEGQKIADDLCEKLDVRPDDLLAGAYTDMLQKNGS